MFRAVVVQPSAGVVVVQLWRSFSWVVPLAVVGGVVVLTVAVLGRLASADGRPTWALVRAALLDGLLALWVLVLSLITLSAAGGAQPDGGPAVDLVPFRDLTRLLTSSVHWEVPVAQIGGNVVLFAAGGVLLARRLGYGWRRSAVTFLVVGVVVEAAQLVLGGRAAVVDDVLLAMLGGVLGAAVGRWWRRRAGVDEHATPRAGRAPAAEPA